MALARRLDDDQIHRLAKLIANGKGEVPTNLSDANQQCLHDEVRRLLHAQLFRFIARAIAARLQRDPGPTKEDSPHA
jgi:hypothetical protein